MSYASTSDVQVSLGRPLTDEEVTQADGLLDRIEARIRARITDLDTRIVDEDNLVQLLIEIEADAVSRKLRNPTGLLQEQDGDYAYTRDRNVASGELNLTDEEWARLGVTKGAFTIAPSLGREIGVEPAGYPPSYPWTYEPGWSPWP